MTYSRHIHRKESDERYTPKWIFDGLGIHFDLDVAAPADGPLHVPCHNWYSEQDDALTKNWHGVVWMNPPYSRPKPWVEKWLQHANGIALLPTSIGAWWLDLYCHPFVLARPLPSVRYINQHGQQSKAAAPWRSWLFAIGNTSVNAVLKADFNATQNK